MAEPRGSRVQVSTGQPLSCIVCSGDRFEFRDIKMVTSGAAFFNSSWMNKSGQGAICVRCGFVHTFMLPPLRWERAG